MIGKKWFLAVLLVLLSVVAVAAPPRKEICPAPANHGAWRAAADRGCAYFRQEFKGLGGHSAFAADGSVIQCIHFSCRPVVRKPDLTVRILGMDRRVIDHGAKPWTWVRYRVSNSGNAAVSQPVYLRVWKNGAASSGYMKVDGPIPAGGSRESRFAVGHDAGWPPGRYDIQVEVDHRGEIGESNEGNNRSDTLRFAVR